MSQHRIAIRVLFVACLWLFGTLSAAAAEKQTIIRIGHIMATDQAHHLGAVKFAEIVSKATNDRIQVKVFPASQLGSATAQMGNVKMGSQEMFVESGTVGSRLEPDFLVLLVPFLIKNHEHARKVYSGEVGAELAEKLAEKQGIRVLTSNWDRAPRHLLTKKPISKLDDLKGVKVRVPANPIFLKGWKALGASPTPMEFSEIYLGLQQGTIEGVELSLDFIYAQKYYEVAKQCTLTYHFYEMASVYANEKFFQSLSPEDQKLVKDALVDAGNYQNKVLEEQFKVLSEKMKQEGVIFKELSAEEKSRAAELAKKVGEEEEAAGKWTKGLISRIHDVK